MIVVTDITLQDVKDDPCKFEHHTSLSHLGYIDPLASIPDEYLESTEETIKGHKYKLRDGRVLKIGWSKQVQEAIGIPIEAFDNLEKNVCSLSSSLTESVERNQKLIKENNTLKNKLQSLRSMTFWQKLKFLFTNKEEQNEQV